MLPSTTLLPRGKTLFHLPLINILKIFKDFFACKFVLAANHQQPENIQKLLSLQICLGRKSSTTRKYSRTFRPVKAVFKQQQPAAAINSSNHPASSIPAALSNQQQQSTAAINSSNQQQQSTAAISSSNQQHT